MSKFNVLRYGVPTLFAISSTVVHASTTGFITPDFRGDANTEYGYWESFPTNAAFAVPISPDQPGATTGAQMTQQTPGAVVTGTFNIYNPAGASLFEIADSTSFTVGTVALQVRSSGTELDYGSVTLSYDTGGGPIMLAPLGRAELDRQEIPGFGFNVSSLWQWDLTGLGISDYTLSFTAAGPHLSLDSIQLDTAETFSPIPEPSSLALVGLGVAMFVLRRQSRTRNPEAASAQS